MVSQSKDYFINPDILGYALKVCSQSVKNVKTIKMIYPHCMTLMQDYAVNLVKHTNKDLEDFEYNPIDFIRKMKDVTETFYSCKHSAVEMIILFCFYRSHEDKEPDYLNEFFSYIVKSLDEVAQLGHHDFRIKDALLFIVESLAMVMNKFPDYNQLIEEVLMNHALPALASQHGLERYRALKLYFEYSYLPFNNEHLLKVAEYVYNSLEDHDIPVKVTAANTLYKLLKKPVLKPHFEPQLSKILTTYIQMMNDVDNEELISSLEEIVSIFSDSIEPFAIQLSEKLCESYWRLSKVEDDIDDDSYGEAGLGAINCITTITKIFNAVKSKPDLLLKLLHHNFKVFVNCTTPDALESLEDALECITLVMHNCKTMTEEIWSMLPQLIRILVGSEEETEGGYGFEYLNCTIDYFRNTIMLGAEELWTRKVGDTTYFELIVKGLYKIISISKDNYSDSDAILAFRVINSMFENLRGLLDSYMPHFIKLIIEEMTREGVSKHYQTMLLETIFCSLYYNPKLTYDILADLNSVGEITEAAFTNMKQFKEKDSLKHVIYGTVTLFKLDPSQLPDVIKQGMPQILSSLIDAMYKYTQTAHEEDEAEGEGDYDDDIDDDIGDDDDDYKPKGKPGHDDSDPDDVYDDEYLFGDSDMNLYHGVFDHKHAPLYFRDTLAELQGTNPEMYQSLFELIPEDKQKVIEEIIQNCENM